MHAFGRRSGARRLQTQGNSACAQQTSIHARVNELQSKPVHNMDGTAVGLASRQDFLSPNAMPDAAAQQGDVKCDASDRHLSSGAIGDSVSSPQPAQPTSIHASLGALEDKPVYGMDAKDVDGVCQQNLASANRIEPRVAMQRIAAKYSASEHRRPNDSTNALFSTPHLDPAKQSLINADLDQLENKLVHSMHAKDFRLPSRQDFDSTNRIDPRADVQCAAANESAFESSFHSSSTPQLELVQRSSAHDHLSESELEAKPVYEFDAKDVSQVSRQSFVSTYQMEPSVATQRAIAKYGASDGQLFSRSTTSHLASTLHPESASARGYTNESATKSKRESVPSTGEGEGHLRMRIDSPPGKSFVVCPCWPYRIQNSFHVKVIRANFESPSTTDGISNSQTQLTGEWRHASVGIGARKDSDTAIVVLTLSSDSAGRPCVIAAEGPRSFLRCAKENWILAKIAGIPAAVSWTNQLVPGAALFLQRPPERALVLRKPDIQVPRLLSEFAEEYHTSNEKLENDSNIARLLAAPVWGTSGVSIMAAAEAKDYPLVSPKVLEELEDRFGVVFAHPAHCAENVLVENTSDGLLRQLVAYGLAGVLHRRGWIFVDTPLRLCLSDVLGGPNPPRANVRVPSIDVACSAAWVESGALLCDILLRPSVRLAQPLDGFLSNPENRAIASPYAIDSRTIALHKPPIHVLPQLTLASITHIYYGRLSDVHDLPVDLYNENMFSEYWRLVHGYRLPSSALAGFARVQFQNGDLSLTYPLACLWRHTWEMQPMLSKSHAPKILHLVLLSLKQFDLLGGPQSFQLIDGPQMKTQPQAAIVHAPAERPILLPISRVHQRPGVDAVPFDSEQSLLVASGTSLKRKQSEDGESKELPMKIAINTQYVSRADGANKRPRVLLPLLKGT